MLNLPPDICPNIIRDFLFYMETIKGRSPRTVEAYWIDLRSFFRFIKHSRNLCNNETPFSEIDISDVTIDLIKTITLSDVYEYLHYVSRERDNNAKTRARKISCLKTYFNYLTAKLNLLEYNPVKEIDSPSVKKSLPKHLSLEESIDLLNNVDGNNSVRDYCILTLFLNCGMRLSELVSININDIKKDTIRIIGKGNKERLVYLNQSCIAAIENYLKVRPKDGLKDKDALFISRNNTRINKRRVEQIVDENLKRAGLDGKGYSAHKLRHTAATLMYQHGNVDIRVLQELLGHVNLGTTEIYTHTSSTQLKNAADSNPLSKLNKSKKQKKD